MIRVFVLDDHELVRRGVVDLIDAAPGMEVVGEASSGAQALTRLEITAPDVAVLDMRLPDGTGAEVCRRIRAVRPTLACLILTAFDDPDASADAADAGAAGFILKDVRASGLIDAIRAVAAGRVLLHRAAPSKAPTVAPVADPLAMLTLRERQILGLIADGMTNRQIGERLDLAEKTVKNYVSGLLRALGMERRTQAAVFAAELRRD